MNFIYFPTEGRKFQIPEMLQDENLNVSKLLINFQLIKLAKSWPLFSFSLCYMLLGDLAFDDFTVAITQMPFCSL